jgi:ribosomal-protein-alanine N-acetyltransferase
MDRSCPTAAHWNDQQYQQLFQPSDRGLSRLVLVVDGPKDDSPVAGESGEHTSILAFLVAHHIAPEWVLENIVVAHSARRNGLGKRLLDALLTRAKETNSDSIFLEVRESNAAARALYERAGFEQTGRRKSYYATPQEDAILYRLPLR